MHDDPVILISVVAKCPIHLVYNLFSGHVSARVGGGDALSSSAGWYVLRTPFEYGIIGVVKLVTSSFGCNISKFFHAKTFNSNPYCHIMVSISNANF